jgi:hypothetical protein
MFCSKLKALCVLVLAVSVTAGVAGLGYRAVGAPPGQEAARPVADELEELRLEVAALRKGLEATRARVKTLEGEMQTLKGRDLFGGTPGGFGGGGGGIGGGRGNFGGGGFGGPGAMFDRFANGKTVVTKADVPVWLQDRFDEWAKAAGSTNGQLTRDQFIWAMQTLMGGPGMGRGGIGMMGGGLGGGGMRMAGQMPGGMGMGGGMGMMRGPGKGRGVANTPKPTSDPFTKAEATLKKLRANPDNKEAADTLEKALKLLKSQDPNRPKEATP